MKKVSLPNTSEWINRFFDFLSRKASGKVLSAGDFFARVGLAGLFVIAALGIVFSVVLTVRYDMPVVSGVIFMLLSVVGCVFLHYVAFTMLPALNTLIKNAPTKMSSAGVLKVMALFVGIVGVLALLYGIYSSVVTFRAEIMGMMVVESNNVFFASLFLFIFCEFWLFLLLRPSELNVEIVEQTSVGEEFIGLTSFFAKGCLKLTPVVFGTAIAFGVLQLAVMLFNSDALFEQMQILIYLCFSAFLPLLVYVAFLSYYFTLDILTAILNLPAKLDKIADK